MIVWQDDRVRVILADEPDYPGFTRVILQAHAAEMTRLPPALREHLMARVWAVEQAQRDTLSPDRVNLASLGNLVPHLHWHVIPRWVDDRHFPQAVWAAPAEGREAATAEARARAVARLPAYREVLRARLEAL